VLALITAILALSAGPDSPAEYQAALGRLEPFEGAVDALLMQLHHGVPPSAEAMEVLRQVEPQLAALEHASQASAIDWGLDYDAGPELLLPELGSMRRGAQLLDAKLLVAAVNGDTAAAADAFGVISRMSDHVSAQRLLISSLVSLSMLKMADASVGRVIDMGLIDRDMAAALAGNYGRMQGDDFLQCVAAMKQERVSMILWLDQKLQDDPASLEEVFAGLGLPVADNAFAVGMLRAQLARAGEAYDAIIAASMLKDPKASIAAMAEVEAAATAGEFGTLAAILLPSTSRVFTLRHEAQELFQERRALLQRIADGEVEPWESAARPWLWIHAARRAAQSKTPWWTDAQVADDVDLLLLHAMAARDSLYPEPWGDLDVPVQWWLPGQWNLLQGLFVRAIEHLDAGQAASAAVDVSIAMDITRALADDGRTAPALVAAEALPILAALVDRLVIAGQDVTQFKSLVRRLPSVRNPAGLGAAAQAQAARLKSWQQREQRRLEQWMESKRRGQPDGHAWPAPHVPPVVEIPSHAAGLVAVLTAIRATLPDDETWNEPVGVFGPDAPPGVHPDVLDAIADQARSFERASEPHVLVVDGVDPGEAAAATQRLRDTVLRR